MRLPHPKMVLLVLSVVLTIAVAALVGEIYLRVRRPAMGMTLTADPLLGWSSPEYREFAPAASERDTNRRILFLGDSFLAGSGIESLDQRFTSILDAEISGITVAVLASGGWSIDQQLWAYQQKGRQWKPDIVVLAFCANNDISSIMAHHYGMPGMLKPYYVISENGNLELYNSQGQPISEEHRIESAADPEPIPLWKRSYLLKSLILLKRRTGGSSTYHPEDYPNVPAQYRLFPSRKENSEEIYAAKQSLSWSPQEGINHVSAYIKGDARYNQEQWRLFETILIRLKHEVEKDNASLSVMLLPVIFNPQNVTTIAGGSFEHLFDTPAGPFTFRSAEPRERLRTICGRNKVLLFDPTSDFIDTVISNGMATMCWPNPGDRHFSATGHKILAEITGRWLRDKISQPIGGTEQAESTVP